MTSRKQVLWGVGLAICYTAAIAAADGITKHIAGGYEAPQLFALSGVLVAAFCLLIGRPVGTVPKTRQWRPTAARCVLTIVGSLAFFWAFRLLPLAEVFLFIGLMPVISATLSGPVLGERLSAGTWAALAVGMLGVFFLFPAGWQDIGLGHAVALFAALTGATSLVLSRYVSNREAGNLAQVFYPNLALGLAMGLALPFVWQPMALADVALVGAYSVALFAARWLCVVALRLLPVYVVTLLMSLQFLWMVWMGHRFFGEQPGLHVYVGALIVIGAGVVLVAQQMAPRRTATAVT